MKLNKKLKFITNLAGILLIQALILSNVYAFLPVERDNLAPDIEISTQVMQGVFSKAIELEQKSKIRKPIYTVDSLDELPFRLRDEKEIELLKLISLKNSYALNGLNDLEKEQFTVLNLLLANRILEEMNPAYKNKLSLDELYYQIVAIRVMIDNIINVPEDKIDINFVATKVVEEKQTAEEQSKKNKGYTKSIVVYKKKRGTKTSVSEFVEETLKAVFLSDSTFTLNSEEGLFNMDIGVNFMDIQKNDQAISIEEMSKIELPDGVVQVNLKKIKRKQKNLEIIAQNRYEKRIETQPITDEMKEKMKNGFEIKGVANLTERKIVAGTIILPKEETEQTEEPGESALTYSLKPYAADNTQEEINSLKDSVLENINNLQSEYKNEISAKLETALNASIEYAQSTNKAPIVKFLSEINNFLKENKSIAYYEDLAKGIKKISIKLYPTGKKDKDIQPRNKEEANLIDAFNALNKDNKEMLTKVDDIITSTCMILMDEILKRILYLTRNENFSIEKAVFYAAQPNAVNTVVGTGDKIYEEIVRNCNSLIKNYHELQKGNELKDPTIINNAPEEEPFILLLPRDINSPGQYWQLRKRYPNLVGIITREGLKHYALVAKQGDGFPILTESYTMVSGTRVSTLDAVSGGELAILDTGEHKVKINPSSDDIKKAVEEQRTEKEKIEYFNNRILDPVETKDGTEISLMANLDQYENAEKFNKIGINGIALYRTEYEYERYYNEFEKEISENNLVEIISEKKWVARLERIISESKVKSFNIRMPDRQISSAETEDAKNFEGFGNSNLDGIRFLLDDPIGRKMALTLMKAAMRVYAKHGVIKVFFPMVSTYDDLKRARDIYEEAKDILINEGKISESDVKDFQFGIMFETPGSILASNVLMQYSDFGSIGSNDLITFLADEQRVSGERIRRGTLGVSKKLTELSPDVISSLNMLLMSSKLNNDYPLSLCGTLASAPGFLLYAAYMKAAQKGEIKPSVGIGEAAYVKEFIRHIDTRMLVKIFEDPRIFTDSNNLKQALDSEVSRINKEIDAKMEEVNNYFYKNRLFQQTKNTEKEEFIPSLSPKLSKTNFILEQSI